MLHALRRADEAGVERVVVELLDHFLAFLDQPFGSLALLALGCEVEFLGDLFEAGDVAARFLEVLLERSAQLRVGRVLRHFRKRLDDLVLGAVEILDLSFEQIV